MQELVALIQSDRIAPGALVSLDGGFFAANVHFDRTIEAEAGRIVHAVDRLAAKYGAVASGVPVFRVAVNERMQKELLTFVPIVVLAVGAVLYGLLGDWLLVFVALGAGGAGCLVTVGLMGLSGVPLTLTTMILPCVLFALGCAYSMHLLLSIRGLSAELMVSGMRRVARPVALSGVTTALGFGSMGTVRLRMIQEVAVFGSIGVIVLTAACLSMVPALVLLSRKTGSKPGILERGLRGLPRLVRRVVTAYRWRVLGVWAGALLVAGAGVIQLRVSTDVVKWFDRGVEVREEYEQIREQLSGITPLNAVIESNSDGSILEPARLRAIGGFAAELQQRPEVGKALAVTDPLSQINEVMTGSPGVPESEELAEQYLLLLEGVEQIESILTGDRVSASVPARVNDNESESILRLGRWAEQWWADHGAAGTSLVLTGFMMQVATSADEITLGLARGLALALLSVAVVLMLVLRDLRRVVVALVPNLVPIVVIFGLMGWFGVPVDAATVVLGSLALGIAVDDTVHIMLGFSDERGDPAERIERCIARVGPALVATTVAVCIGFGVLSFSEFRPVGNLGILTAALIGLCLVADLVLLPSLLMAGETSRGSK
jgi:predicted RND superfamily exporter protein